MTEQRADRRLAAILAADVAGYSRLMGADEEGTLARLKAYRRDLVDPKINEHRGRIVKTTGDGLLAEFASVVDALRCAVEVQRGMAERNSGVPPEERIDFRLGLNVGDIVAEAGDIYGDGVNVATRLEGLAEPGGVCVSGRVLEDARGKLDLAFEDLGEQKLKNIAWPVRVLRVRIGAKGATSQLSSALPDRPSIAVLPFENMSGHPDQECFADGLTENIITALSRFRDLFVIARHSSFAYKGKAAKIPDVCRELGVRYVLEGGIQRSGDLVRITAQLIDGTTGRHLWAERYDRRAEDVFAVQDEVTETIVGTLATGYGGRLRKAWRERVEGAGARSFQAFDFFLRGIETMDHFTKEDNKQARELFHKAVQFDASYGKAYAKLAWTHIVDATFGWSGDVAESWARGLEFATAAIERDDDEAWGHWALAGYYMYRGQHDRTISEFRKALELNPNDADVMNDFGWCLSYAGRAKEGLEMAQKAMRLNPHYPEYWVMQLGQIYYDAHRYDEAIGTLEGLRHLNTMSIQLYLAASHAALGHTEEAQSAIRRVMELDPQATLGRWTSTELAPYKIAADLDHFREYLRKAGLPE
jgi:adenylate cyclase